MIVLKMLREHPQVKVVHIRVDVMPDGTFRQPKVGRLRSKVCLANQQMPFLVIDKHCRSLIHPDNVFLTEQFIGYSGGRIGQFSREDWDGDKIHLALGTQYRVVRERVGLTSLLKYCGEPDENGYAYFLFVHEADQFYFQTEPVAIVRPIGVEVKMRLRAAGFAKRWVNAEE